MRFALFFLSLVAASFAAEAAKPLLRSEPVATPAAAGAMGTSLVTAPDGAVWLSWIEKGPDGASVLRFSTFDASAKKWNAPGTVARGNDWYVNWTDFPSLTVGENGQATAVWSVNNPAVHQHEPAPAPAAAGAHVHDGPGYHAMISRTTDGGKTWSAPAPLTRETDAVEFVALATLADGRVLASWLDGRTKKTGGRTQLYTRIVGGADPDVRVDASVCDCCPTALTAFLDGSALLAYRGRSSEEVRDIRIARFRGTAWEESHPLNNDDWKINGCPVNGPQLVSDGGRVAAAWYTAAGDDPRVQVTYSPDAGTRFLRPLRLDTAPPAGRVDTLLLRNGSMLVTWSALDGGLWLRRVSPEYSLSESIQLAPAGAAPLKTVLRMALLRDYPGAKVPAQVLVTFAQEGADAGVRTLLVTVPEAELIEAEKNCDCETPVDEYKGFPMRGTIEGGAPPEGKVWVKHPDFPGIMAAGTHAFRLEKPESLNTAAPGRQFLGRIERRNGEWWLFDIRLIAMSPAK